MPLPQRLRLPQFLSAALCALLIGASLGPARAGWQWQTPPVLVTVGTSHRNNVFYVGQPVVFSLQGSGAAAYEVRDYSGNVVDQGPAASPLTVNVQAPGWYKLYLFGSTSLPQWGNAVGSTTFVIFRNDPHFPQVPSGSVPASYAAEPGQDNVLRGIIGLGPQRHYFNDSSNPDATLQTVTADLGLDQQYYLAFPDPVRPRDLMVNFPGGGTNVAGVTKVATQLGDRVHYWESQNEPNTTSNRGDLYANEEKAFAQTIHAVNPALKVIGPTTVSIGPDSLGWIEAFFRNGGGDAIDAFGFHSYNATNGDLWLGRTSLDNLNTLLAKYGQDKKEKWETEQGFSAASYGLYQPRHQGRWTMLQTMVFEQYGIPKEHTANWYDWSHGFWDVPVWWINDDGSLNPMSVLMRVWSEECFGTKFAKAYDFGSPGNNLYLGNLFQGPGKSLASFMSAGGTDGQVTLKVSGGTKLHIVSAVGVASDLPIVGGQVVLPVPEVPVYVEMAAGQTIQVVPVNWGTNLALQPGVTASASGAATHPSDSNDSNDIAKLFNGKMENWYYDFTSNSRPWSSNTDLSSGPAWVEMDLPVPTQINRVVIYCPVPNQSEGTLLDYELQYDSNGRWVTLSHTTEPPKTFPFYSNTVHCTEDSYYSDRCIFTDEFPAVKTGKIRVLVHDCTWGGVPTQEAAQAGGGSGPHQITIREIEVYSPLYNAAKSDTLQGRITDARGRGIAGVTVSLSGSQTKTTTSSIGGAYSFSGLTEGGTYTVSPSQNNYTFTARTRTFSHLVGSQSCNFAATALIAGSGTGLLGEYFKDQYDEAHAFQPSYYRLSRIEPTLNLANWAVTPDLQILFAVRWTGLIEPKYTEQYTLTLDADDGVRLWINDKLLIDHWVRDQSRIDTATVKLTAGQRASIRLEYFQLHGSSRCRLYWSSAHQAQEIIPQNRLYPGVVNQPPLVSVNTDQSATIVADAGSVLLSAVATDPDGTIAKVVFSANGTEIGTSASSPFRYSWTPPRPGSYQITATAYDNVGAATQSDPVTLAYGPQVRVQGMLQIKTKHSAKKKAAKKKAKLTAKKSAHQKPLAKKPAAKKPH